jgi:hypothetical protein
VPPHPNWRASSQSDTPKDASKEDVMSESPIIELLEVGEKLGERAGLGTKIAEILLTFYDFDPPSPDLLGNTDPTEWLLLEELDGAIGIIANRNFPQLHVRTELTIKSGSLLLVLSLWTTVPTVYKFFKDYEELRKGVLAFVGDLNKSASWLHEIVEKHLKSKRRDSSDGSKKAENQHRSGRT